MIAAQIEMILLITGWATAGALIVFLAPSAMMRALFGQAPTDAPSLMIVRHWGLLVCLVGVLLIYAAHFPEFRAPALIVAITEKAVGALGALLSPFRRRAAVLVVALADAGMAVVYTMYLAGL